MNESAAQAIVHINLILSENYNNMWYSDIVDLNRALLVLQRMSN